MKSSVWAINRSRLLRSASIFAKPSRFPATKLRLASILLDWPQHIRTFKAIGYDGTITLEVFAPEKGYLLLSRDLLRRWWEATS